MGDALSVPFILSRYSIYYLHYPCSVKDTIVFPSFSVFVLRDISDSNACATWTRIFLKTEKKIFVFKNIRIHVSLKDHITLFTEVIRKNIYLENC